MNERRKRSQHIKRHASKQLRVNLLIFSFVYAILVVVTLYNVTVSKAFFTEVLIALIIGFLAGFVSSRMYKISWNTDQAKVVGRIDLYGATILVLFIVFELNRDAVASLFTHGEAVGSVSLVLVTAALIGRIVGTSQKIIKILRSEKIIRS